MAYIAITPVADGDVLSATTLNNIRANIEYLQGVASGVNVGFQQVAIARETSQAYHVVHSYENLYVYATIPNSDTEIQIYYDGDGTVGNELVYEYTPAGPETITANIDLTSFGYTVGSRYEVTVSCRDDGGTAGTIDLYYLAESGASL